MPLYLRTLFDGIRFALSGCKLRKAAFGFYKHLQGRPSLARHRRRLATPAIVPVVFFFALVGLLLPNSAQATVAFDTSVSSTGGFATNPGANCPLPSITPTASVFTCTDDAGDFQTGLAAAAPGILRATARVLAISCGSSAACLGNVSAHADFEDSDGLIFNSNTTGTITIAGLKNIDFSADVSATGFAVAFITGRALVNGQQVLFCDHSNTDTDVACLDFLVTVPLNTPITLSLLLDVFAFANAGFTQTQ
jgi:hypothetical protein